MSWKIDNIDFKDYGVRVVKSSGVLDMPKIVDQSIDWLDQDGRDYWEPENGVKYESREIVLNCWIRAEGYEEFKIKVDEFYQALVAPGERILSTRYGNEIEHVTVQHPITMVRKTSYLQSRQIGMFTLRLTVAGDKQYKLMTVYNTLGEVRAIISYGNDAKLTRQLQGDCSITFESEFNSIQTLGRGDYILFNNEKWIAFEYPQIDKISTNKFVYRLTYSNEFFALKDVLFHVIDNPDTAYYGNMNKVVDLIISNANRAYPGLFVKGNVEETENRNHQFQNENCYDVLSRLTGEYELEFEFMRVNPSAPIVINVVQKIGSAYPLTFEYGRSNRAYKISRIPTPREKMCTLLWVFGSTKNIPADYGFPRLKLAAPLERPFYGMHLEREKTFDDIFPEWTGTVSSYQKKTKPSTWVYAPGTYPGPHPIKIYTDYPDDNTYELTDLTMFNLNQLKDDGKTTRYLLPDKTAKIHFNSGDLAGLEFEVLSYDDATKTFKLIPINEGGTTLPSEALKPVAGDQYKILDINPPDEAKADAEARLAIAGDEYMNSGKYMNPHQPNYSIETNISEDWSILLPGYTVTVIDDDFGVDDQIRIVDITSNIYSNGSSLVLAPYVDVPKRKRLEVKVEKLERSVQAAKIDEVNQNRGNEQTTREVKNDFIDPVDEKLRADKIIRRRSIDPVMLSDDAGTPQFSIEAAIAEPDIEGNPNKIRINPGAIISHNYYAVDRVTRKQIIEI